MSEEYVRVAVRVRPLLAREVLHQHRVCVRMVPGTAQVMLGPDRLFSFDHAFGPADKQEVLYETCVQPLVESLVRGFNATVFCYGQTGSGKTYTLGGGSQDEEGGIIERVAQDVFLSLEERKRSGDLVKASVRLSYMELYREELRDLLEPQTDQKDLHIREDDKGNTVVVGAKEVVVTSLEELLNVVETGNALRHSASTGMNDHSSRSHTILTLQVIQCCHNNNNNNNNGHSLTSTTSSKLCLVDLAGSERAGKTGNVGIRLKESVHINTGLLALGNVIRALSDPARNRRGNGGNGTHVPYRDAKITRLLRDSLGGTAHTLMVACVSPSHHSVAETLGVLQFATKARHICNCPTATSTYTEDKSPPTAWDPGETRVKELEYEVQTLRKLLRGKELEMEKQREQSGESTAEPQSRMRKSDSDGPYRLLTQEAAVLLADIPDSSLSCSLSRRLQVWQERLKVLVKTTQSSDENGGSEEDGDLDHHVIMSKLREELKRCKEALCTEAELLEQKEAELTQVQKDIENLLHENRRHLQSLEEERERNRLQSEQLVEQQILIDRLLSNINTFQSSTSGSSGKRPHSVPLIGHSSGHRPPRKIHSSPPAYSLERVMAAFKTRGHLLLAELEEKDEVHCPLMKQQAEGTDSGADRDEGLKEEEEEEEEEEDNGMGKGKFRRSLNRTWTSRQKSGNPLLQQSQGITETEESPVKQCNRRKGSLRASVVKRRIQHLSLIMGMEEELIKELDKTEKGIQAAGQQRGQGQEGEDDDILAKLSTQSRNVRSEVYRSLQHMTRQREDLQNSLRQQRCVTDHIKEHGQQRDQRGGDLSVSNSKHREESVEKHGSSWLEQQEELVLRKRAELQELQEELRKREEVVQHREACLQQKNKLEIKQLRASQALGQDLLRVSMQLESVEQHLQSSSSKRVSAVVTTEELETERDMLLKRKDVLEAQLIENRGLNVEENLSLLELEEAIEALDAALDFKNRFIREKEETLSITESSAYQSTEPAQLCDVIRKLKQLSPPEASELLVKYFNKVVRLRETENQLRLRCQELELNAAEQEGALREMEAVMQHLHLHADQRVTQQHREHQQKIQLLLQKLQESNSGESQQVIQDKLQHLEKELFFYKSSSRQLKKKLHELSIGGPHPGDQPLHKQERSQTHNAQIQASTDKSLRLTERILANTLAPYTRDNAEPSDQQIHGDSHVRGDKHETLSPSLSADPQRNTRQSDYNQKQSHTQSQGSNKSMAGECGDRSEMIPVRLCRRRLKQISLNDLQGSPSVTGRRQSAMNSRPESVLEDSTEAVNQADDSLTL